MPYLSCAGCRFRTFRGGNFAFRPCPSCGRDLINQGGRPDRPPSIFLERRLPPGDSDPEKENAATRAATTVARTRQATQRDEGARWRDVSALVRDRAAEARDRAAERKEASLENGGAPGAIGALKGCAATVRAQSASDRARATTDRACAGTDRIRAADDRRQARIDLRAAHLDDLTGAYTRGLGLLTMQHEIDRAHRSGEPCVLAFIDVDGLKQVNDRKGHAAGDVLLRDVVGAIQTHLRSYDPIVRVGGDEFVCALGDSTPAQVHRRFQEIRATIEQTQPAASISVGLAALRPDDTLDQLTERGDTALYEAKHTRQHAPRGSPE